MIVVLDFVNVHHAVAPATDEGLSQPAKSFLSEPSSEDSVDQRVEEGVRHRESGRHKVGDNARPYPENLAE